jgi:hypothetical protein
MNIEKFVLIRSVTGEVTRLDEIVAGFIRDGIWGVSVFGEKCVEIEDLVDAICVGDASEPYFLWTRSHPDEPFEEVVEFLTGMAGHENDGIRIVEI